jgi:hypothetical protein
LRALEQADNAQYGLADQYFLLAQTVLSDTWLSHLILRFVTMTSTAAWENFPCISRFFLANIPLGGSDETKTGSLHSCWSDSTDAWRTTEHADTTHFAPATDCGKATTRIHVEVFR